MKKGRKIFWIAICLFAAFAGWTVMVRLVDVRPIGPWGSIVGFAGLNDACHRMTGVHLTLYTITDWLGLVPIAVALGFAVLGLCQWIKRRSVLRVDRSILVLGGFYLAVMVVYLFFEMVVINRRPVLIEGYLEASYPSSTTMLVLCVMPTAMLQLYTRIRHSVCRRWLMILIGAFTVFMTLGRLFSGVHWITDIIGGIMISTALVLLYLTALRFEAKQTLSEH